MKLAKLSLAAMVAAGLATSSFAADTLSDAFAKGKVNGELRAWYWDFEDTATGAKDADIFNTGLMLGYVTDSFYGFSMGATFQSNFAPDADADAKSVFGSREYGSGAVLSEAYLGYTMKNTTVKIGRQFITTPLVSGSGSHMIKEAFEGATIVNTDLPGTTLVAGYVTKFQSRTSSSVGVNPAGDVGTFEKTAAITAGGITSATFDGAYTVAAINKSVPGLTLTAQYAMVNDVNDAGDIDLYFVEAGYVLPMSGFKLGFDAQYRGSKTDGAVLDALKHEGNMVSGRVSISELAGFGASFAYGTTSSDDAVIAGVGNGPGTYTGMPIRASAITLTKDTDSYKFDVSYDFAKAGVTGLKGLVAYRVAEQNAAKVDYTTYLGSLTYDVAALKGLSLAVIYETQEKETTTASTDQDEIRFQANYKF